MMSTSTLSGRRTPGLRWFWPFGLFLLCLSVGVACDSRGRTDAPAQESSGDSGAQDTAASDSTTPPDTSATDQPTGQDTSTTPDASPSDTNQGTPDTAPVPDPTSSPEPTPDAAPDTPAPRPEPVPDVAPQDTRPDQGSPDNGNPSGPALYLYDEDTNQFLIRLSGVVDLKPYETRKTLNIALKYNDPRVKSVQFTFDQDNPRKENAAAYTVFASGDHRDRLTKGTHTVLTVVYDGADLAGKVLYRFTTQFTIKDDASNPPGGTHLPKDPTQIPADPTFSSSKKVSKTIVITKSGTYDYKNVLHIWSGSGSCNQNENQPHILRIEASNVTVKNFAYRNAPDGIHIATCGKGQGNTCTGKISNITLDNVTGWACEDALTTGKGTSKITIKNSFFMGNPNTNYRDKCLQINFGDDLHIEYTIFKNCKRPVRFKSGSKITLKGNRFYIFDQAVKGDTFKDISGIIPDRAATVLSEGNHFQSGGTAHFAEGKTTITSVRDNFVTVRRRSETKSGGKVIFQ